MTRCAISGLTHRGPKGRRYSITSSAVASGAAGTLSDGPEALKLKVADARRLAMTVRHRYKKVPH
jgi:hypothetical protein